MFSTNIIYLVVDLEAYGEKIIISIYHKESLMGLKANWKKNQYLPN